MATLTVPSPDPALASFTTSKKKFHRPLSTHGMPKEPRALSPDRPHRFSGRIPPSPAYTSNPMSPRTPGPMSPPMSAKSFGTFIDSAPSTPAYSPRMDYDWDNSTLVLLRPMSSSSEPTSPTEPPWDMMIPVDLPKQPTYLPISPKGPVVPTRRINKDNSVPSKSTKEAKVSNPVREVKLVDILQREYRPPRKEEIEEGATSKPRDEPETHTGSAPLGKLASKMKLMLRRKNTREKKQKKEKEYEEVDRIEEVHWTEM